jgi:GTP-binding protein
VFRPATGRGFEVARTGPHAFRVGGPRVDRLVARFDLDNEEALEHVEGRLRRLGVMDALDELGFQPGDEVEVGGVPFELDSDR